MSDPNTLPCGHPASMLLMSAETGKPLYCEYCDCIARRNDAEQREREQGGRIAALEAEVADARRACRDMENELSRKLARAAMTDAERMREVAALREERDAAIAKALEWRDAVDAELVTMGSTAESFPDARTAVKAAIDWHMAVALDPAVSSDAAKIRDDALEEAAKVIYDASLKSPTDAGIQWCAMLEERIRALKGQP